MLYYLFEYLDKTLDVPGTGWISTYITAGDGSQFPDYYWGGTGGWHWTDGTNGHAGPQYPDVDFGKTAYNVFQWGVNLYALFNIGLGTSSLTNSYTFTGTATIDLLDATGALLNQAVLNFTDTFDKPSQTVTATNALTLPTGAIGPFNRVRASFAATFGGAAVASGSVSVLFFFLQAPVEI